MTTRADHFWLVVEQEPGKKPLVMDEVYRSKHAATEAARERAAEAWDQGAVFFVLETTEAFIGCKPKTDTVWLRYPVMQVEDVPAPPGPEAAPYKSGEF